MRERKMAVVTGALKGLGLGTSRALAEKGYQVLLTGRNEKQGQEMTKQLLREGLEASFLFLDVAESKAIEPFSQRVLREFGRVDVLVNNAGVLLDRTGESMLDEARAIEKSFITNALGPYLLCRSLVPQMVRNGFGRVVNVSSGMGQLSQMEGGYPGYRMSKTALNAVTRMFADETKGTNVLVNSVCPGWVRTDMGGAGAPRSIEEGLKGILWAATLPDGGPTGGFFRDEEQIEF